MNINYFDIKIFKSLVLLFGIHSLVVGCQKNKWNSEVEGRLIFEIEQNSESPNDILDCEMDIHMIEFTGNMIQGGPQHFILISEPISASFSNSNFHKNIQFYQGSYKNNVVRIHPANQQSNTVRINGSYSDHQVQKNFNAELEIDTPIECSFLSEQEIFSVVKGDEFHLSITIDPNLLFQGTTPTMWNNAIPDFVTDIVTISPSQNIALYQLLASSFGNSLILKLE
jgi:hypothetical protein